MQSSLPLKSKCFLLFLIFLASASPGVAQNPQPSQNNRDSLIVAAREIMGQQKYCALITMDSAGLPDIRTMNPFPPEDDMTVWMATNSRSRKAADIRRNPSVSLYYANHASAAGYVTIRGKAYLVSDTKEIQKRYRAYWDQAFPDKKYLLLVKIVPEKLEVVNYKRNTVSDSQTWKAPTVEFPAR